MTLQKFFDFLSTIPSDIYICFNVTQLLQILHCFVTLFRLSTFDYPGWDKATVRSKVDILYMADLVAIRLGQVAEEVGIHNNENEKYSFSGLALIIDKLKAGWASKLSESQVMTMDTTEDLPLEGLDQWYFDSFLQWSENT